MKKKTIISIGIVIIIGLAMFFSGYQAGKQKRISQWCQKILTSEVNYINKI